MKRGEVARARWCMAWMILGVMACGAEETSSAVVAASMEMGAADQSDDASAAPRDMAMPLVDAGDLPPDQSWRDMRLDGGLDLASGDMGEVSRDASSDDLGEAMGEVDMGASVTSVYVGRGDVFSPGALAVARATANASPDATRISLWYPAQAGTYAVIVFQHGFLMDTAYYDSLLTHVASHGFIVAAPQMYAPGDNPFGKPTSAEEAASARSIWQSLGAILATSLPMGVVASIEDFGVMGHSRGAKVIWHNLIADPASARAAVGIDPVDGRGGLGSDPAVLPAAGVGFALPTLFIGTGLGPVQSGVFGPACAPAQDGYLAFFAASQSPSYELVATEYGHLDMLEDQPAGCGFTCNACEDGSGPRAAMRRASAGWSVALMRRALQGGDDARFVLSSPELAPISATARSK